ncbi:MAG: phasin family protein [Gammaproteobacteria bacterium]|nr:phasin family protein [Gammaproteobacteria bacterium]
MQNEYIEQWQSLGKETFGAIKELESIGTRALEQLAAQNLALVNVYVETGVRNMGLVNETRGYKELVAAQMELASTLTSKVVENGHKSADILNDLRNELTTWYEGKVSAASKAALKKAPVKKAA